MKEVYIDAGGGSQLGAILYTEESCADMKRYQKERRKKILI
jgi:hypothetical protein